MLNKNIVCVFEKCQMTVGENNTEILFQVMQFTNIGLSNTHKYFVLVAQRTDS